MEIILKQPVRNLGDVDDVVKVKSGYARNFLIPQGLAVMATASAKKAMEEKKRQASHKVEFVKQQATDEAAKLDGLKLSIETLAGADGKLFGSVTNIQIANKLKERGFLREGYKADLVLVDPNAPWKVDKSNLLYKCGWSPFEGTTFRASVEKTFVNGETVFDRGDINGSVRGERAAFDR